MLRYLTMFAVGLLTGYVVGFGDFLQAINHVV